MADIAATYGSDAAASAGSTTITRTATFGAGETIVVHVQCAHGTATCTVADGTNTYNIVSGATTRETFFATRSGFVFEAVNVAAGSPTITVTFSTSVTQRNVSYVRLANANTGAAAQDGEGQFQINPTTGTDATTTGNMTPTSQPNGVVGWAMTYVDGSSCTQGTGFTSLGVLTAWNALAGDTSRVEFKRTTSTTDVAATFTVGSASEDVMTLGVVISEVSGAAAAGMPPRRSNARRFRQPPLLRM